MHLLLGAVMVVAAGALLLMVSTPSSVHGPLAIITFVRGALVPLAVITLLNAERVTPANTGLANGLWFSVAEVGGVSGPLTVGALADRDVGHNGALLTVAAVALFGAAVAWLRTSGASESSPVSRLTVAVRHSMKSTKSISDAWSSVMSSSSPVWSSSRRVMLAKPSDRSWTRAPALAAVWVSARRTFSTS